MSSRKKDLEVKDPIEVSCPFCPGRYVVDGDPGAEPVVLHSMPTCTEYDHNDVFGFLRLARRRINPSSFD